MFRLISYAGALAGAVALSQFPEYSQQYLQRLAGAVDELRAIVVSFDATAAASGLTREEALADLSASPFQSELQSTLAARIRRYEELAQDYLVLRQSDAFDRLGRLMRFTDPEIARRTWQDFRPAVPATADGMLFAGIGLVGGWAAAALVLGFLRQLVRPLARRAGAAAPPPRARPSARRRDSALVLHDRSDSALVLRDPSDPVLVLRDRSDGHVRRVPPPLPGVTRLDPSGDR